MTAKHRLVVEKSTENREIGARLPSACGSAAASDSVPICKPFPTEWPIKVPWPPVCSRCSTAAPRLRPPPKCGSLRCRCAAGDAMLRDGSFGIAASSGGSSLRGGNVVPVFPCALSVVQAEVAKPLGPPRPRLDGGGASAGAQHSKSGRHRVRPCRPWPPQCK